MGTRRSASWSTPIEKNPKKSRLSLPNSADSKRNQLLPILCPELRNLVFRIINQLDPKSLCNLARTCKGLRSLCLDRKSVLLQVDDSAYIDRGLGGNCAFNYQCDWISKSSFFGPKLHFNLSIELLTLTGMVDSHTLDFARNKLESIPVTRVRALILDGSTSWPELIQFIKEFGVKSLIMNKALPRPQIPLILGLNLLSFTTGLPLPMEQILSSSIPHLNLFNVDVSMEALELIIEKWMGEEGLSSWTFHSRLNHKTALALFRQYDVREFDCEDVVPQKSPLAFRKKRNFRYDNDEITYFLPCSDGRVLRVVKTEHVHGDRLRISLCPPGIAPPALRS